MCPLQTLRSPYQPLLEKPQDSMHGIFNVKGRAAAAAAREILPVPPYQKPTVSI
jgi:hypothetical protein